MEIVAIDGSKGEGGGQILRTSLALSCLTLKSVHIENIRNKRPTPGLAKQHLSCIKAACKISDGTCKGNRQGSTVLDFKPGQVKGGKFRLEVGSAGSTSLVIQTILPTLILADEPSIITVKGGTHNPYAPPFDFFRETFLPAIKTAGFWASANLTRYGFFPAGGGEITAKTTKSKQPSAINLDKPSGHPHIHARIYTAKLPPYIASKQKNLLLGCGLNIENIEHIDATDSDGPGNCIMIRLCQENRTTIFTTFGTRGKPSEKIISELANLAGSFINSDASVDYFLADQLLIYMAIVKAGCLTTNKITSHLQTNIEVIKKFLPVDFIIKGQGDHFQIRCIPAG